MKIGFSPLPQLTKPAAKKEQPSTEMPALPTPEDTKEKVKQVVQQHIAEMEAARTDMGEDDPKAQQLIEKFKSGKKLSAEEMMYIRKHAPGMVEQIDRVMREREMIELSMKLAPSKADVQLVAFNAAKQINKHENSIDRELRTKHLMDAKHEYEKTDEYKDKPNTVLDRNTRPKNKRYKPSEPQTFSLAKAAYLQAKHDKKETSDKPVQAEA